MTYCKRAGLIVSMSLYGLLPPRCWPGSGWTWSLGCASGCTPLRHLLNVCSRTPQSHLTDTEPGSSLHQSSAHCLARYGLEWRAVKQEANWYMLWSIQNLSCRGPTEEIVFVLLHLVFIGWSCWTYCFYLATLSLHRNLFLFLTA